jgi:hypothetical protein
MPPSTEPLDAPWPPAGDPVIRRLAAARPEPPVALLDPGDLADRIVAGDLPGPRRPRERRLPVRLAAVAAAAAVVAAVLAVAPFGSTTPRAAEAIARDAAVASAEALGTGRAVFTSPDGSLLLGDEVTYTFAGDDLSVEGSGTDPDGTPFAFGRRVVDGELYFFWDPTASGEIEWLHDMVATDVSTDDLIFDPRGLLALLAPTAGFELAGEDTIDGVEVTRLHATRPEAVDVSRLRLGEATMWGNSLSALDVWVDGDDVVRRIDITQQMDIEGAVVVEPGGESHPAAEPPPRRTSVRFTDIGAPLTVEAPATSRDVDPGNPPPA